MINQEKTVNLRVLVAPLDWGLGHATRCIPIIRELLHSGMEVLLAADGAPEAILRAEFPQLKFLKLDGYRITYGVNKIDLVGKILLQIPKILQTIQQENAWLEEIVELHKIDVVISDNRYGLYNKKIYSVFISHQLHILTGLAVTDRIIQNINHNYINNFDTCWIPDVASKPSLGGQLSHPKRKPVTPLEYIGWQSRFDRIQTGSEKQLLILLSGPEPQRAMLEEMMLAQLENYDQPVVLLRGLPGERQPLQTKNNITAYNHLDAGALEKEIANASFIVARSGYSTVMDLIPLRKKTILIPTPGQTEQEYLADHLVKHAFALSVNQEDFNLKEMLRLAEIFPYEFPEKPGTESLRNAITALIEKASQKTVNEEYH